MSDEPKPIQALLKWAFQTECAQLEMPDTRAPEDRGFGFGMEFVLIERARLGGVQIDTSRGRSYPHEDADVIAAITSRLPRDKGGQAMAIKVAECARSGLTPDWMRGVTPRLEPREWRGANQNGRLGKTAVADGWLEPFWTPHPRNTKKMVRRVRRVAVLYTPCRWSPSFDQITSARNEYNLWRAALEDIRDRLISARLVKVTVADGLPPKTPWAAAQPMSI